MEFNGKFSVNKNIDYLNKFFSDINNVIPCLPGIYDIENINNEIKCKIKLDVKDMNIPAMSTITGKIVFKYILNDNSLNVNGSGRIAGSKIKLEININYKNNGNISEITWVSSFDFGLIVKIMNKNKINEVSMKNIDRTMKCIIEKINN